MKNFLFLLSIISFLGCQCVEDKVQHSEILLEDGWYFQADTNIGVQRQLTKAPSDNVYFLEKNPFLSFDEVRKVNSNLITDVDSVVVVDFVLTNSGTSKWQKIYADKPYEEFLFVLNDSIIAFHREYIGSSKKGVLNFTLSYSDYNNNEIHEILTTIRQKIKG